MDKIDNLYAYNNEIPGQPICFEVQGTVIVRNPNVEPVLVEPTIRHKGGWEVLELKLDDKGGIAPQVLTEKRVEFKRQGATCWKKLEIILPEGGSQTVEIGQRTAID